MVLGSLSSRRRAYGYLLAVVGAAVLVAVLVPLRGHLDLASDALLFLLLVVTTAILGGLGPALLAGALGSVLLNFLFTEPFHTFQMQEPGDIVAVLVFTLVALMVGWVVDLAARRASAVREAAELEAGNRLRTALLAAVGHDLRTPLAAAKAVVSGLLSRDVTLTDEDRRSCSRRPTTPSTGSPHWWTTCSTSAASRPGRCPFAHGPCRLPTSLPEPSTTWGCSLEPSCWTCPISFRMSWSIQVCSRG